MVVPARGSDGEQVRCGGAGDIYTCAAPVRGAATWADKAKGGWPTVSPGRSGAGADGREGVKASAIVDERARGAGVRSCRRCKGGWGSGPSLRSVGMLLRRRGNLGNRM